MNQDEAIRLANSNWWKDKPAEYIVNFQLFEDKLCMSFEDFHKAVEESLDRPVFTHEFGLDVNGLRKEFLSKNTQQKILPQDLGIDIKIEKSVGV